MGGALLWVCNSLLGMQWLCCPWFPRQQASDSETNRTDLDFGVRQMCAQIPDVSFLTLTSSPDRKGKRRGARPTAEESVTLHTKSRGPHASSISQHSFTPEPCVHRWRGAPGLRHRRPSLWSITSQSAWVNPHPSPLALPSRSPGNGSSRSSRKGPLPSPDLPLLALVHWSQPRCDDCCHIEVLPVLCPPSPPGHSVSFLF